jgi:hypothetical protein
VSLKSTQPVQIPVPNAAAGAILPVPFIAQGVQQNWCWAACAEMVLRYYSSPVQACDLANKEFKQTTCCVTPTSTDCDKELSDDRITRLYYKHGLQHPTYTTNSISETDLATEIQGGRPIELGWTLLGGGAHAVLVVGSAPVAGVTFYRVHDPQYSSAGNLIYARLLGADGYGSWDATWTNLRQ